VSGDWRGSTRNDPVTSCQTEGNEELREGEKKTIRTGGDNVNVNTRKSISA